MTSTCGVTPSSSSAGLLLSLLLVCGRVGTDSRVSMRMRVSLVERRGQPGDREGRGRDQQRHHEDARPFLRQADEKPAQRSTSTSWLCFVHRTCGPTPDHRACIVNIYGNSAVKKNGRCSFSDRRRAAARTGLLKRRATAPRSSTQPALPGINPNRSITRQRSAGAPVRPASSPKVPVE